MTREEFITILSPYLVGMRTDFDAPTLSAYYRVLKDVPAVLFGAVIDTVSGQALKFVPRAGEFKTMCEQERKAIIAKHPFQHCDMCDSMGWRSVLINGTPFAERCMCWSHHRTMLEILGAGSEPLALPPADMSWTE